MGVKSYVEQRMAAIGWRAPACRSTPSSMPLGGHTAETMAQSFPVLTLEQVYGAVAYYLANREVIDAYLRQQEADFAHLAQEFRRRDPMFYRSSQMRDNSGSFDGIPAPGGQSQPPAAASMRQ